MFEIIPAIDLIEGKCVRLTKGDYSSKKIYNEDPLEVAKGFEAHGIKRLHLVDLDGAKAKKVINFDVLERISKGTSLQIDFGGGVQSDDDIRRVFDLGAAQVTGGSIAVKNRALFETWLSRFGGAKIILGADARDGKIAVSGWEEDTETDIFDFISSYLKNGVQYTISTDVQKDGLLQGPSIKLYEEMHQKFPDLHIIASGGVAEFQDLVDLRSLGIYGVIVGKAIYEGRISLKQIEQFILNS